MSNVNIQQMSCTCCGNKQQLILTGFSSSDKAFTSTFELISPAIHENLLLECLLKYYRWYVTGKPKYEEEQTYYDNETQKIEYLGEDKYSFAIKRSSSEKTWKGVFVYRANKLNIVEVY